MEEQARFRDLQQYYIQEMTKAMQEQKSFSLHSPQVATVLAHVQHNCSDFKRSPSDLRGLTHFSQPLLTMSLGSTPLDCVLSLYPS